MKRNMRARLLCVLLAVLLSVLCGCDALGSALSDARVQEALGAFLSEVIGQAAATPTLPPLGAGAANAGQTPAPEQDGSEAGTLDEEGVYTSAADVALYLHTYGRLPDNFITKDEARGHGWSGGSLERYAPGKCIGGDPFGNREGLLPKAKGRAYYECDVDTLGADSRGAKRLVYSSDGLIYYTDDHYASFALLYGEE